MSRAAEAWVRTATATTIAVAMLGGGAAIIVRAVAADRPALAIQPISADPPPPIPAPVVAEPAGLPHAIPVALDIPAAGIHTPLMQLDLSADGSVAVPPLTRSAPAGWFRFLASPGETGTAVIVGHVDSARDGPAVFYRLGTLRAGDTIAVLRADGRTAGFVVDAVREYPKSRFPAEEVYQSSPYPELRLITCGGSFDRRRHHYRDLVVVFATAMSRERHSARW